MKYKVTLKGKVYEVEVEQGSAMIIDEYELKAPSVSASELPSRPAAPSDGTAPEKHPSAPVSHVSGIEVKAPLPGNVLSVSVSVGQKVKSGDVLAVIEAMKMENEVLAPVDGSVKEVSVTKGQVVSTGDLLFVI